MTKAFTDEEKERVLDVLASSGKGLRALHKADPTFPSPSCIRKWMRSDATFRAEYVQARQDSADFIVDDMIGLADTCKEERVAIEKCKLQIEARKVAVMSLKPKLFADHSQKVTDAMKAAEVPALDFSKLDITELATLRKLYSKMGCDNASEHSRH